MYYIDSMNGFRYILSLCLPVQDTIVANVLFRGHSKGRFRSLLGDTISLPYDLPLGYTIFRNTSPSEVHFELLH